MPAQARMVPPDRVGHRYRRNMQRTRLEQLETVVVERPLDLDRYARELLYPRKQRAELADARGIQACWRRRAASSPRLQRMRASRAMRHAPDARVTQRSLARNDVAIRDDLTLRDGGAETARCGEHPVAFGGAAQATTRDARRDQRLDEDRHRGVRRGRVAGGHV